MLHFPERRAARVRTDALKYSHAITPTPGSSALERALQAALRLRRPQVLERLAGQTGPHAFAQALAGLNLRQMADALSLLPAEQRLAVCAHLPAGARRRWQALNAGLAHAAPAAPAGLPSRPAAASAAAPSARPSAAPRPARRLLPRPLAWVVWPWRAHAAGGARASASP